MIYTQGCIEVRGVMCCDVVCCGVLYCIVVCCVVVYCVVVCCVVMWCVVHTTRWSIYVLSLFLLYIF